MIHHFLLQILFLHRNSLIRQEGDLPDLDPEFEKKEICIQY